MNSLLDSSILIDYLRRYAKAESFIDHVSPINRSISIITAMEIVQGARNTESLKLAKLFVNQFNIIYLDKTISLLAFEILSKNRLVTSLDISDCLIAATAISKDKQLYTRNIKHFQKIFNLKVDQPY